MRAASRRGLALAFLLLTLIGVADEAKAVPPSPAELYVEGGEEAWHPRNRFRLGWRSPDTLSPPIAAVGYRVLDPFGAVIDEGRLAWAADRVDLDAGALAGEYAAEVWFEDTAGVDGAVASASLRFDDARPGPVAPRQPDGWIGRTAFPYSVRIDGPAGPLPLSGIRGYAVMVGRAPLAVPCAGPVLCTSAETDLEGGLDSGVFTIPELPEGTNYVHAVAVSGSGVRSAESGRAVLRVDKTDPQTQLFGIPDGWINRPVSLTASADDSGSGMRGGAFTAIQVDGGAPTVGAGGTVRVTVIKEGIHEVAYYARDAAGNLNDGALSNGKPNREPSRAKVKIDRTPPTVAFVGSEGDPELITARVTDSLSGPSRSRGQIGVRRLGSGDPFVALGAEVTGPLLRARWDSEGFAAGEYEFRAVAFDAAGNAVATSRRADGTEMALANPLKATTVLKGGFGRSRDRHRLAGYGQDIRFGGRLIEGLDTPVAGAIVRIVERFGDGSERVALTSTASDGAFSILLEDGPSREVTASFGGTRDLTRSTTSPARLDVRSEVQLRVSAGTARVGGRPVVFTGKVVGESIPKEGKSVELQFRLPGLEWSEFRTIQTDRRGRFRYAYRFADDDSRGVRFRFRAYAPAQSGWPYEPGGSRPVAVRGR